MKVLVIGSGGREHALAWMISRSPLVKKVYCIPGNAGIAGVAECISLKVTDMRGLMSFALEEGIDLTVVGPELPLTMGIVDDFNREGLCIVGPDRDGAVLEGSKSFAKELMRKYAIPTADYEVFSDENEALKFIDEKRELPVVVKADGLAAGKGVVVCKSREESRKALDLIMRERAFGSAGDKVIIEDFLSGDEASFIALTDGNRVMPLASSQDHKQVFDGDNGPNTGGMGAYSPAPLIDASLHKKIMERIIGPVINAMEKEGRQYRGILYAGLMIRDGDPFVLEFNVRFGDPETQPILMRLKDDIVPHLMATTEGRLSEGEFTWDLRSAVCVVMASGGYPGNYRKGMPINGLETLENMEDVVVFHAGTLISNGEFITNGGRVLGVTALGKDIVKAREIVYDAVRRIGWEGVHYRRDIGEKALKYY